MEEELLKTLGDFTSRENWDKFFTIKGSHDPFEWYSEWLEVSDMLLHELRSLAPASPDARGTEYRSGSAAAPDATACRILVPGCGNSRLSECLHDAGFRDIINIDFSRVVISDMLRLHIRTRPSMRWRVMDMTDLQFADGSFDAVVDKGGLDALMEPERGSETGNQYLSEVKRVLNLGGKFICLTLAESHVLELLFSKFRCGWKIDIKAITLGASGNHGFQTFFLVATKDKSSILPLIVPSFNRPILEHKGNQTSGMLQAIDTENKIRRKGLQGGVDIVYSLEDLKLGSGEDIEHLISGRRLHLILGGKKMSRFSYKAVVLDSKEAPDPPKYQCAIFLVPKTRAHEWLFSSEEGQWLVVENAKASRLIMVFLDSEHSLVGMDAIQVTSTMTGEIVVEDVVYEETEGHDDDHIVSKDSTFRRLGFKRSLGLVQSEALLVNKNNAEKMVNPGRRKSGSGSRITKKSPKKGTRASLEVDHSYLASPYHSAVISGFLLIASNMERLVASGEKVKIGDGIPIVCEKANSCRPVVVDGKPTTQASTGGLKTVSTEDDNNDSASRNRSRIDVLIIDADSADLSTGLTCPPANFVEESFVATVKEALNDGLFIINMVTRSPSMREKIVMRVQKVFAHVFCLKIEEDVNEVLFALGADECVREDFLRSTVQFQNLFTLSQPKISAFIETAKMIKRLK
ncbi:unnamed protein product [Victoria cruziana]